MSKRTGGWQERTVSSFKDLHIRAKLPFLTVCRVLPRPVTFDNSKQRNLYPTWTFSNRRGQEVSGSFPCKLSEPYCFAPRDIWEEHMKKSVL